jgi:DNA polymerase-1
MPILIYDEWGIKHDQQHRPDMSRSVDAAAREEIIDGRYTTKAERIAKTPAQIEEAEAFKQEIVLPFTEKFDRYKKLGKQAGTYLKGLAIQAYQDPDNKIYTELKLIGTESGRKSSAGPNLQNITRPKEGLPNIRQLFYAPEGRKIVNADLSQAELRVIAKLSGDTELLSIYRDSNRSLHKEMAREFYGEGYTGEEYVQSKNINFGVAYLQGAFSFSKMYKMPQKQAQEFINKWWIRFPQVLQWTEDTKREVHEQGTIVNPFGRKRRFYLITDENKDHAYKEAINFKAQSTASDITATAEIMANDRIDHNRGALLFSVHDSIVGEVDDDYVPEYSSILVDCMVNAAIEALGWDDIPFKADVSVGQTWGTTEELELAA